MSESQRRRISDIDLEGMSCTCATHGKGAKLRERVRKDRGAPEYSCRACDNTCRDNRTNSKRYVAHLRSRYGMSEIRYAEMLIEQRGYCAICSDPMREPCVDHSHSSGMVRGLLCRNCNIAIGYMRDDPLRLAAAISYLNDRTPPA